MSLLLLLLLLFRQVLTSKNSTVNATDILLSLKVHLKYTLLPIIFVCDNSNNDNKNNVE